MYKVQAFTVILLLVIGCASVETTDDRIDSWKVGRCEKIEKEIEETLGQSIYVEVYYSHPSKNMEKLFDEFPLDSPKHWGRLQINIKPVRETEFLKEIEKDIPRAAKLFRKLAKEIHSSFKKMLLSEEELMSREEWNKLFKYLNYRVVFELDCGDSSKNLVEIRFSEFYGTLINRIYSLKPREGRLKYSYTYRVKEQNDGTWKCTWKFVNRSTVPILFYDLELKCKRYGDLRYEKLRKDSYTGLDRYAGLDRYVEIPPGEEKEITCRIGGLYYNYRSRLELDCESDIGTVEPIF